MARQRKAANLRKTFGTNVRVERVRAARTLEDLAGEVGTTSSYMSRAERGLVAPTLDFVERVAGALAVHPAHLLLDLPPRPDKKQPKLS